MKPKLLFYCQHVLGMGHMVRSREIVKGLAAFDVTFINGGEPVEGFSFPADVRVVQLPPVSGDAEFRAIDATEAIKAARRDMLLRILDETSPELLVIEMFPFGRRKFAFELVPLLEEIERRGHKTRVVSSVRDILVSKRDQLRHEDQACTLLNRHFDLVLVHSDPRFQRLEETFHRASSLTCAIEYTGFVVEPVDPSVRVTAEQRAPGGPLRILASAGGGRVGLPLLDAVVKASAELAPSQRHELVVYTGPYLPDAEFAQLKQAAATSPHIRVERFATDFVRQMAAADLVISMAGYNTCMNILTTGVPALVLPFTGNQNEEQTIRARKLAALGLLEVLEPEDLEHPAALAKKLQAALAKPRVRGGDGGLALNLDGTANTNRLLEEVIEREASHV